MAEERIPAFYEHKNVGKHMVVGGATRTKYGYFGGGRPIPEGVFPADVRERPYMYSCGNCRGPFTVTATEVFCPNCSTAQVAAFKAGRPITTRRKDIIAPVAGTPPPPLEFIPLPEIVESPDDILLEQLDFGGTRQAHYIKLLNENGIYNAGDAEKKSLEELIAIPGIGEKTASDLLKGTLKK